VLEMKLQVSFSKSRCSELSCSTEWKEEASGQVKRSFASQATLASSLLARAPRKSHSKIRHPASPLVLERVKARSRDLINIDVEYGYLT
jgi:hypothetical protein